VVIDARTSASRTVKAVNEPVVIAHRGVPGQRLEHTADSYRLGIEQGADYIEPDLVVSADGELVVRHENEISSTTDVADRPEFAGRRAVKTIDGVEVEGWFTEDFTLAELRTLRPRERLPALRPQNAGLPGQILTFDEVIDIALAENARRGEPAIGVYPETKHPSYFAQLGFDITELLLSRLRARGLDRVDAPAPVVIQSMESENLRQARDQTRLPLLLLMDAPRGVPGPEELARIAEYADGIGPHKRLVIERDAAGRHASATSLVADAHAAGLFVHVWTLRDENRYLPADLRIGDDPAGRGDAEAECLAFYATGVDGVFSDFVATAVSARARLAGRSAGPRGSAPEA